MESLPVVASLRWIERKRPLQVVRAFAQAVGDEEVLGLVQSPSSQVVHGRGADGGCEDPSEVGWAVGEVCREVPDGDTIAETGAQVPSGSQRQIGGGLVERLTRLCAVDGCDRAGGARRHEPVRWVLAHDNTLHSGDLRNDDSRPGYGTSAHPAHGEEAGASRVEGSTS